MSEDLPKRLRQLAKEMTEGDPKTASMLILAAKELEGPYVPEGKPAVVRTNEDGSLDEVVAENCQFHLEQIDGGYWWIGINAPDKFYHICLHTKSARITASIESEERHSVISGPSIK